MKVLRTLLFTLCFAAGLNSIAQNTINATEAHITINGETSREQLMQLRTDMLAQGIDFRYIPQFDGNRKLISIEITVTANNGQVSGAGKNMNLQNANTSMVFHVNKTTNSFSIEGSGTTSGN